MIKSLKTIPQTLMSLTNWGMYCIMLLLIIPIFVPFSPKMPDSGLDPSWATALNQAIAQHLSFGKDILFTLGPYSSIYTKVYHPATDLMMMFGSFYLACSYWYALLILMNNSPKRWFLALIILFSSMMYVKDSLFFSYPLLIGIISYKNLFNKTRHSTSLVGWFFLFAPLGLLILIKCSLILISFMIVMLCTLFFIIYEKKNIAYMSLTALTSSLLFFWIFSGQSLAYLFDYLIYSIYFIFVFTEAMALNGNNQEIIFYLIASVLILALIYNQQDNMRAKCFLLTLLGIFLFFSFKTGFTRHNHAIIPGTSLLIAALFIPFFIPPSKFRLTVIIISVASGLFIASQYRGLSIKDNLVSTYFSSWYGLKSRIKDSNWLKNNFDLIMEFQRTKASIPIMEGTTDIYSYEQTYLISSGNQWSPRPVFQSYSTFSPFLAKQNKRYLESNRRPDNILFRIEPIDGRLPALEDSLSWPLLIKNYQLKHQDNHFLYLRKANKKKISLIPLDTESHHLGEVVPIPFLNHPLFISLEIKPSLFGLLSIMFFKINQLVLIEELENGMKMSYRLSSSMARASFLLSPLIENTEEFALLYSQENLLTNKRVKSFTIQTTSNTTWQWQNEYLVHFKTL